MNLPIMLVSKHYRIVARMDKIFSKNNTFNMKLLKSSEKDLEKASEKNDSLIHENVQLIKQVDEYRKQLDLALSSNRRSIVVSLFVGIINGALLALLLVI